MRLLLAIGIAVGVGFFLLALPLDWETRKYAFVSIVGLYCLSGLFK